MNTTKLHNYILNLDSGTTTENMHTFISDYLKDYPEFTREILSFIDEIKVKIIAESVVNQFDFFIYDNKLKSLNEEKFNDFKKIIQEHINPIIIQKDDGAALTGPISNVRTVPQAELTNDTTQDVDHKDDVVDLKGPIWVARKFAIGAFDEYLDFDSKNGLFKVVKKSYPEIAREVFKNDDFAFEKDPKTGENKIRRTFENNIKNTLSNNNPETKNLRKNYKALKTTIIYFIENDLRISNLFLKICDYCDTITYDNTVDKHMLYDDLYIMEKTQDHLNKHKILTTEYFKKRISNLRINK